MKIGIAADHGGFELKSRLIQTLESDGYEITDFGNKEMNKEDDYPDYVIPLAKAVANGDVSRGIAICGGGVGVCVEANKVAGVKAALITDPFSAHQGVEDDNMNIMCLGGWVSGYALSRDLIKLFLEASFKGDERFKRRLTKVEKLEKNNKR